MTPIYRQLDHGLAVKAAQAPKSVVAMSGVLYVVERDKPWGLLSAPNAFVRGVFQTITEPGIELPTKNGKFDAHITVFRPEEIAKIGGPRALVNDRGRRFNYDIGGLQAVAPEGWDGVEMCWLLGVTSPELEALRVSHGLPPLPNDNRFAFHLTVAIRRRGVLTPGPVRKAV
jgi:hypothetical protein